MEFEKYYLDLKTQKPINYDGLTIYQPSLKDIQQYGIDYYNQIMLVYSLTLDCFNELPNKENISIFDDLILEDDGLLRCLGESLYVLTKADEIILHKKDKCIELKFLDKENIKEHTVEDDNEVKHYYSFFDWLYRNIKRKFNKKLKPNIKDVDDNEESKEKTFVVNSTNFDDISDIILKINANKKIVKEKPPDNMSERQKDVWYKLQEGRNREAKKNEIHIYDILNICEFGGNYHISIEQILDMSLWNIMNCYKSRTSYKNYDDGLQIALVSGDGKSISGENHWLNQLMIRE